MKLVSAARGELYGGVTQPPLREKFALLSILLHQSKDCSYVGVAIADVPILLIIETFHENPKHNMRNSNLSPRSTYPLST